MGDNLGKWVDKTGGKTFGKVLNAVPGVPLLTGKGSTPSAMFKGTVDPLNILGINKEAQPEVVIENPGEAQYSPLAAAPQQTGAVGGSAFANQMELDNQRALQAFRNSRGTL